VIIIKEYRLREIEVGCFYVHSFEINVCPVCGHRLLVIGTRVRKFINAAGDKQRLIIRRLRCEDCRKIHHELPDILMPYKRHCASTIEMIIIEDGNVCCDDRTIRRIKDWWATCSQYFKNVINSLREKYGNVFSADPAPREIIRAAVNAHLWIHTRSAYLSG